MEGILRLPDCRATHTVVLADGDYPVASAESALLASAARVVCCDGAADRYVAAGGEPEAIIGDLDSISDAVRERYADRLYHDTDQETNDLTKAVTFCAEQGYGGDIIILGATGKREDHTIGNISLLATYNGMTGIEGRVRMVTAHGVIDHITGDTEFESQPGQQVTILCLDPATHITTHRLRYPLHRANLRAWWMGTLNESLDDTFCIGTDGDTFVYRLY
ncbi:MAG: thiamine diphosphokinase [Rikenellaceae bacterium]|nr:thiamine diphosphokinase [Rikenellaceae bacterium]